MLILDFLKHSKLKLSLPCAVVEFLFNRAVYVAVLVDALHCAWDLILNLRWQVSLVVINRRDLVDRGDL